MALWLVEEGALRLPAGSAAASPTPPEDTDVHPVLVDSEYIYGLHRQSL